MTAYRAALESGSPKEPVKPTVAAPRSLRWLVEQYYQSAEYRGLGKDTRRVRKGILDDLCEKDGDKPFALLEPRHVRTLRGEGAGAPHGRARYH